MDESTKDDFSGKAKETAGKVTGKDRLESEGKADQAKASAKDLAENTVGKAKDAVGGIKDSLTGNKDKNA